jgi:tripartite-type tricarboxylate transporter receptor subunit TctC
MRLLVGALAVALAMIVSAKAEDWPARQVSVIVPFAAGGTTDFFARVLAQHMEKSFGKPFVVENKPGAGGNIGTTFVARAAPDGYTIEVGTVSSHAINPSLYKNLPHDTQKDFQPVSLISRVPNILVTRKDFQPNTVEELVEYAKANPGKINYGSAGAGTPQNIACELFKMMAGVNLVHVPYKGGAPAVADLISGHVQVIFAPVSEAIQHVKSGKLRALAVTTAARLDVFPDLPTVGDFLPGYEASGFAGIGAPKNTPPEIINLLNKELNAGLADPKIKERIVELGGTVVGGTPAEFGKLISEATEKWAKVIKFAGIKAE